MKQAAHAIRGRRMTTTAIAVVVLSGLFGGSCSALAWRSVASPATTPATTSAIAVTSADTQYCDPFSRTGCKPATRVKCAAQRSRLRKAKTRRTRAAARRSLSRCLRASRRRR